MPNLPETNERALIALNGEIVAGQIAESAVTEPKLATEAVAPAKAKKGAEPANSAEGESTAGAVGVCRRQTFTFTSANVAGEFTIKLKHSLPATFVMGQAFFKATGKQVQLGGAAFLKMTCAAEEVEVALANEKPFLKGEESVFILTA